MSKEKHWDVVVVGGGAAGLIAAGRAAEIGASVLLVEKNNMLGKKILISGKGRCNVTNAGELEELIAAFGRNGKFLHSAFSVFSNKDCINFFQSLGIPLKTERGKRVFPESDASGDIIDALVKYVKKHQVVIKMQAALKSIICLENRAIGIQLASGDIVKAKKVILATGGSSYPGTGSTGEGYSIARKLGHTITAIKPSLVPLVTSDEWVPQLQGLALKNVQLSIVGSKKKEHTIFGEMLFTHFGVSGPIVLTLSKQVQEMLNKNGQPVSLAIDLKPALSDEKLDQRIQRDFEKYQRKQITNGLTDLLPNALIPVILELAEIDVAKFVHQITREERLRILDKLKNLIITVTKTRPLTEAIVTAGGISLKEVDPRTMESKLIKGLFFAGEILDVDGITGGFNLQAAFSTGYLAGLMAGQGSLKGGDTNGELWE